MKDNDYASGAMDSYKTLPQETEELYKDHYVRIPFELEEYISDPDKKKRSTFCSTNRYTKGLSFDAVMCGDRCKVNNRIVRIEEIGGSGNEFIENSMYNKTGDKYAAYINAHSKSALFIDIPESARVNLNVQFMATSTPLNVHVIVKIGKGARLDLTEICASTPTNTVVGVMHEITLQDNAHAEVNTVHCEDTNTVVLCFLKDKLGAAASLRFNSTYIGGSYTRARNIAEAGTHDSKIDVNELVFGSGAQKFDIYTRMENTAPNTYTNLHSRTALMDTALCILKGYAKIDNGARMANSYIKERSILLDKGARVDSLPDMSVDQNDVKASHSSSTAPIDPEGVFYLMSKGMDSDEAKKLIVGGFFSEYIESIDNETAKELTKSMINEKFEK